MPVAVKILESDGVTGTSPPMESVLGAAICHRNVVSQRAHLSGIGLA